MLENHLVSSVASSLAFFLFAVGSLMAPCGLSIRNRKFISDMTGLKFLSEHAYYYFTASALVFLSVLCVFVAMAYSRFGISSINGEFVFLVGFQSLMGLILLFVAIKYRFEL